MTKTRNQISFFPPPKSEYFFSATLGIRIFFFRKNKGNNKITELRTILQRESQNSQLYKQTKSVNNRKTVKTAMTLQVREQPFNLKGGGCYGFLLKK